MRAPWALAFDIERLLFGKSEWRLHALSWSVKEFRSGDVSKWVRLEGEAGAVCKMLTLVVTRLPYSALRAGIVRPRGRATSGVKVPAGVCHSSVAEGNCVVVRRGGE